MTGEALLSFPHSLCQSAQTQPIRRACSRSLWSRGPVSEAGSQAVKHMSKGTAGLRLKCLLANASDWMNCMVLLSLGLTRSGKAQHGGKDESRGCRFTRAHEWNKNDERLLSAVEHGEADKVAALLTKKGASAVKLDSEGKSALHVAATRGQAECLALILAQGVDASLVDASGFSALHLAAKNNHQECAKKLIQEGLTPLLLSAKHAHADVCSSLLDWGADVNARDKNSRCALMLASESSCVAAVEVLLQRGADLHIVDSLGHDVLHYAKLSGSSEITALLNSALQKLKLDSGKPPPPRHNHPYHCSHARAMCLQWE
ncbi:hypothetical protein JZ751_015975 [Albula glossodonta]|uniref:Uncharacterized protein n=1 Tax=Albula glossodonta TaxID=121402 RepID=A0A8T2NTN9_9TELE|nr:hypothetical protein JZ751_015975 [Albula glossodonta]